MLLVRARLLCPAQHAPPQGEAALSVENQVHSTIYTSKRHVLSSSPMRVKLAKTARETGLSGRTRSPAPSGQGRAGDWMQALYDHEPGSLNPAAIRGQQHRWAQMGAPDGLAGASSTGQ